MGKKTKKSIAKRQKTLKPGSFDYILKHKNLLTPEYRKFINDLRIKNVPKNGSIEIEFKYLWSYDDYDEEYPEGYLGFASLTLSPDKVIDDDEVERIHDLFRDEYDADKYDKYEDDEYFMYHESYSDIFHAEYFIISELRDIAKYVVQKQRKDEQITSLLVATRKGLPNEMARNIMSFVGGKKRRSSSRTRKAIKHKVVTTV